LFSGDKERDFRTKWHNIQTGFVDEPRHAVEEADELVAELMQQLAQSFSDQRSGLEKQWDQSDKVSTEDLRLALRRYRSFFERLLAI
jgi:phage-related protein